MLRGLEDYTPQDDNMTTESEIERVAGQLHLEELDRYDLQNLRDMVVLLYSAKISVARNGSDAGRLKFLSNAMMSITAVIDLYIYSPERR